MGKTREPGRGQRRIEEYQRWQDSMSELSAAEVRRRRIDRLGFVVILVLIVAARHVFRMGWLSAIFIAIPAIAFGLWIKRYTGEK